MWEGGVSYFTPGPISPHNPSGPDFLSTDLGVGVCFSFESRITFFVSLVLSADIRIRCKIFLSEVIYKCKGIHISN